MDADAMMPVRVAFVSSHAGRGGSERYLRLVLEHLDPDWIGTVVCLEDGPFATDLRELGFPVDVIATGRHAHDLARSAGKLRRLLGRASPAVVHANGLKAALVAELASLGASRPVIWFKHDVSREGWLTRLAARRAARVIGPSHAVIQGVADAASGKVEVLNYQIPDPGVDAGSARELVLREFAPEVPETVVALVGRLDAYKGQDELIGALPSILARSPGVRVLLVGGEDPAHPEQRSVLEREIAGNGLDAAVRFTGFRSDATSLMCGADVLAIPERGERRLRAGGVPVRRAGSARRRHASRLLRLGCARRSSSVNVVCLVEPGDRTALADAIVALAEDEQERERLAACGRARFDSRYLWSTLADNVAARYRAVAGAAA